jgi:hypothetical protein
VRLTVLVETLYLGMSVALDDQTAVVAVAAHDTTYLVDFAVKRIPLDDPAEEGRDVIANHIIEQVEKYEHENFIKFLGAGLPTFLHEMSPTLCSRLWLKLDIVPIVLRPDGPDSPSHFWHLKRVDEQADSMGRKCLMHFGPTMVPLLQVGFQGRVETDASFKANLTTLEDHRQTCSEATWNCMQHYAMNLKNRRIKIAFFSSTPQGGGVALMRHALVRLARLARVDLNWYGK